LHKEEERKHKLKRRITREDTEKERIAKNQRIIKARAERKSNMIETVGAA